MVLFQDGWKYALSGLLIGHVYYYLKFILPAATNKRLLETP